MPEAASVNTGAVQWPSADSAYFTVRRMQTKLHRWAGAESARRFGDLFNLVYDPAFLVHAWERVSTNAGARTPGVDRATVAAIQTRIGVEAFLSQIRDALKSGTFAPVEVRQVMIPKASGKLRALGIPTVRDRVVQAALKLVLEPIFEADFEPVSYGFRPRRRAHDAIAEIHKFGTNGYRWVLDADIEACFDTIDHTALMARVRLRVRDKRVVLLVKAFCKAGLISELGEERDTPTGTPQGGILSPLLANIALSVLDEHLMAPWKPGGTMSTGDRRRGRRARGSPTWRLVRYADDFVVLVHAQTDTQALREEIAQVLAPIGLRLSPAKTAVVHMSEGFDFLGFRIQWRRKRGTNKWHVYTFIADRPVRSVKAKIRALTHRTSQLNLRFVLIRLNQIMRGWSAYFKHAVAKHTFSTIAQFAWKRVVTMVRVRHRWTWPQVRRWLIAPNGRWQPPAIDGIALFNMATVPVTRYRHRGSKIPNPWIPTVNA